MVGEIFDVDDFVCVVVCMYKVCLLVFVCECFDVCVDEIGIECCGFVCIVC